jgi:hypothetical protein
LAYEKAKALVRDLQKEFHGMAEQRDAVKEWKMLPRVRRN